MPSPPSNVKLRGHHLLCMLGFVGKGYTPAFIENFDAIISRLNAGAEIAVVEGPDDICAALHNTNGHVCESGTHCLKDRATQRDRVALAAVSSVLNISLKAGSILRLNGTQFASLRRSFADGVLREACKGCEWHETCTTIADTGFKDVKLMPRAR